MDTIIYVIIAIFILLYIIDKKEPVPPEINTGEKVIENQPLEKIKEERRKEIYKNIFTGLKEINPLKTYRTWTYIEIPNHYQNIQLSYERMDIPVYYQKCIELMKQNVPELIILTPLNIKEYLPTFQLEMGPDADVPLKFRIDILFASILEVYGGLCISPGTIVYNIDRALSMLKRYEIVTFGGSPKVLQSNNNLEYPNSYVLGSQKNTPFIQEYKRLLLLMVDDTYLYNFKIADDTDILSHLIQKLEPSQFHFGSEYDGSYNSKLEEIQLSTYMGTYEIDFKNKDNLLLISFPYDKLYKSSQYKWFLNLSESQFMNSNLELKNLLQKNI